MSAFDWITTLRGQFHDREILTGMEWNVPGHEHASSGCLEANGKCIAEFEYRFDNTDTDTDAGPAAAGMNWGGKILSSAYTTANGYPDYSAALGLNPAHNKAIAGLAWLNANHPDTAWVNPAHIERAGCGVGGYSIAALRDMNDTAPTVFFGFEGMPGHQKASNRGEFSGSACGGGSYGGAGTYIATVGGVWDSLLGDGRKFFNFVSSDFHMTRDDFYPGEYSKTYVKVKDNERKDGTSTQRDILDGLRSGNSFAVHGDLIDELDFRVFSGAPFGNHNATMGETLSVGTGEKITVQVRFKSPSHNNCKAGVNASAGFDCASYRPAVHHVQLIQGRVNPTRAKKFLADGITPNPAYNSVDSGIASVVKIFDATYWKKDTEGFTTMNFVVPRVGNDTFFRIRGTNKGYNEAGQTDEIGDPLLDTPGANNADEAWKDLWFYSNPIFVKVREGNNYLSRQVTTRGGGAIRPPLLVRPPATFTARAAGHETPAVPFVSTPHPRIQRRKSSERGTRPPCPEAEGGRDRGPRPQLKETGEVGSGGGGGTAPLCEAPSRGADRYFSSTTVRTGKL